jgi:hypothetical protein
MSIGTPNGILDITGATLRVSKMEFRQSTGFDTVLNNVARNTMLLMDETEQTTSNSWALKLPNAWVAEFHGYWASGSSGAPILFNFYNDSTSGTNGYTLSMNDTTISINYDGGSTLGSATLSTTLNNDAYRKVAVIFERSVLDVSVDGEHVFHFADSQLRDRVYDNNSGYVTFTHSSTDERKLKNLKFTNGDKWVREIDSSNIAYVGGNVGIGTTIPGTKLDVSGTVRGTHLMGDGSAISAIQSSNVSDFGSNVTRIGTLETDLGDNSSRITNLSSNLSDNSSRITALETGNMSISGDKTFTGDIIFESNIHMNGGNVFVANTVNMTVSDPIIELGLNNIGTNDLGIIMTRPAANSNVAVVFDESDDILRMGYTLNGASDSIVDLDSNALAVSVQGALSAGSNLEVGTANLFVDTTTSNVGVGVSSPAYKLDVGGDVNLSTGSTLRINGIPAVFSNWTVSGSDIYRSSGNVGIGTASPRGMLDIYTGATSTAGLIIDRYASGTYRSELYQESNGLAIKVGDGSNAPTENMRITRSDVMIPGRLALGTSTASSSQFYISAPGNGTSTSTGDFHMNNSAGMTLYGTRPWITTTNGQGHTGKLCSINLHASGHQPAIEWTRDTGQGTNQRNWLLRQETDDALYTWHYNGSAWSVPMYVKSDAVISQVNVGIGTASPGSLLTIESTSGNQMRLNYNADWYNIIERDSSGDLNFLEKAGASASLKNLMTIKTGGNVGIGTNDPSGDLHVHGENIYFSSKLVSNCTWRIMPQTGNSTKKFRIYDNDNSADRFVIDSSGHVIIGDTGVTYDPATMATSLTATPSAPILHVNGTIQLKNNSDAIVIGNNNATFLKDEELHFGWGGGWYMNDATNLRVVNNKKIYSTGQAGFGGNVGIGVTSPAVRLHVEGSTAYDGSCTTRLRCAASAYGRNQLQLIGRYEGLNDAWSATGARNAIMFKYQTSSSSAYTDAWTIQSFPNGSNNDLGFMSGTNNTPKVVFRGNGNVGIGTTNPQYGKLHINGNGGGAWTNYYYFNGGGGLSHSTNWALANTSLYVTGGIVAGDYVAASDERIKKDIVDADDSECLEALRLLKPKRYRYKDELDRGEGTVWGFIAQEVRETLPHSTKLLKSVVPNIYEMGNVSSSNVITFTNFNTADLESNATTFIRTMGADGAEHGIHLEEVIDEHTIRVKEDLTDWIGSVDETGNIIAGTQLFVYGQEVDNFVFLKKDAVWTTATAALQEVDRQLQAEKTKTATLETQVASLLERVTALENA